MAEPYRLHESLGYHLSLSARIQESRLEEGLRRLGLTRTTWCILLAAGNEGLRQPSEIAAFIGIDRTATSRALRTMEQDGLIRRTGGGADGRKRSVTLTDLGFRRLTEGAPIAQHNNAVMSDRLSDAELQNLKSLLKRLAEGASALRKF